MSEYRDITDMLAADIEEAQAEADARLEIEAERVERALEWERAKERVKRRKELYRKCMTSGTMDDELHTARELLAALDELEKLEAQS